MLRSPRRQAGTDSPPGNSKCVAAPPPCGGDVENSDSPIAEANPQGVGAPREEVEIYFAVDLLGIASDEVIRLCKTGALHARRNRHGTWWIDKVFLVRWHEANLNYGAVTGCELERGAPPIPESESLPCPPGACESHWERRGQIVPVFRANLCQSCHSGRPLPMMRADL